MTSIKITASYHWMIDTSSSCHKISFTVDESAQLSDQEDLKIDMDVSPTGSLIEDTQVSDSGCANSGSTVKVFTGAWHAKRWRGKSKVAVMNQIEYECSTVSVNYN